MNDLPATGFEPGGAEFDPDSRSEDQTRQEASSDVITDDGGANKGVSSFETGPLIALDDPENSGANLAKWVSWGIVATCCIIVFISLDPLLLLQNSTATGGDMGAHVWGPRFLADHLLPQFRLSGWTQDWYAGFPAYVFYMVVPSLFVLWLSYGPPIWLSPILLALLAFGVWKLKPRLPEAWMRTAMWIATVFIAVLLVPVPYNIAFKLVTVSGLVTLPIAAYCLAKAARVAFPGPPLIALASLGFIYDKGFTILGGNGASTLAGEFAFSISLTLAVFYLAVIFKGVRTSRDRALGATLLALTILCHLIPAIFAGIATILILLFLRREDRTPWWDATKVGRWVAGVLVGLTLFTLISDANLPGLNQLRRLPGATVWFPSQWWFPGLATFAAIALLTGFEPRFLPWLKQRLAWIPAVLALLVGVGMVAVWSTWWVLTFVLLALVFAFFVGIDTRLGKWILLVGPVGGLLTGFWSLPFLGNSAYMNDMGWEKYTKYSDYLLAVPELDQGGMPYRNLIFALAGLGLVLALIQRVRFGWFLGLTILVLAWTFRYFPQYRLWNARLLPFYYLAFYLLAGLALALIIRSISLAVQDMTHRREEPVMVAVVGAFVVLAIFLFGLLGAFRLLPGGALVADPTRPTATVYRWSGINFQTAIVSDWARWNYSGLEGKDAYPEFIGIMNMMKSVSAENGCGRAFWEYDVGLNRHGTTMALMLLPYYTDGCVGSMEGLYFEASSTTPFHFLTQSELSTAPSRAQRELPYNNFNIKEGVSHLQLLGVKYYMATTEAAIAAAKTEPRLTQVANQKFNYSDTAGTLQTTNWSVFEVADSELAVPLKNDPVVVTDADDHIDGWVYAKKRLPQTEAQIQTSIQGSKTAGPAVTWFNDPTKWDVLLATSGPADWPRSTAANAFSHKQPNPPIKVSNIVTTQDSIEFDVDKVGVPVLVKISYFPNWHASGAEGPYRVSPNFMAVVPTEKHVVLGYGYSKYDLVGWFATLCGLVALGGLAVLDHRRRLRDEGEAGNEAESGDGPDPDGDSAEVQTETSEEQDTAESTAPSEAPISDPSTVSAEP